LSALLVGLIFSDFEERILPDEMTVVGFVVGMILAYFIHLESGMVALFASITGKQWSPATVSVVESCLGALGPSTMLWSIGVIFERVRHKEGLGFGDVKMVAMIGAFLGLRGAMATLILGSALGSVTGLAFILIRRKELSTYELPFGSFLGAAALVYSVSQNFYT
jgi:leader peptidase (prepilin peptidase)/N-methyltransferase